MNPCCCWPPSSRVARSGRASAKPGRKPDLAKAQTIVESGLRRVPRRRRQQREPGESEYCGTARRVYHPATGAFQGGDPRQCGHAGHGGNPCPEDMKSLGAYFSQQKPKASRRRTPRLSSRTEAVSRRRCGDGRARVRCMPRSHGIGYPEELSASRRPVRRLRLRAAQGVQGGRARRGQGRQGRQRQDWRRWSPPSSPTRRRRRHEYLQGLR